MQPGSARRNIYDVESQAWSSQEWEAWQWEAQQLGPRQWETRQWDVYGWGGYPAEMHWSNACLSEMPVPEVPFSTAYALTTSHRSEALPDYFAINKTLTSADRSTLLPILDHFWEAFWSLWQSLQRGPSGAQVEGRNQGLENGRKMDSLGWATAGSAAQGGRVLAGVRGLVRPRLWRVLARCLTRPASASG